MPARPRTPPETCAQCGAEIPPGARACPSCGADERTGWRGVSVYDGLDLPGDAGGGENPGPAPFVRRAGLRWVWLAAGVILLAAMILFAVAR